MGKKDRTIRSLQAVIANCNNRDREQKHELEKVEDLKAEIRKLASPSNARLAKKVQLDSRGTFIIDGERFPFYIESYPETVLESGSPIYKVHLTLLAEDVVFSDDDDNLGADCE